jgi:hypothetical protein
MIRRVFNIDQRIMLRSVLAFHGYCGISGLDDRSLLMNYYWCRGTPVAWLFNPHTRPSRKCRKG